MGGEWREVTIGDIGSVTTGKTPSTKSSEYFGGDIPFVTPRDLADGKFVRKTERYLTTDGAASVKGAIIPRNSVMVSCIGSDMGEVVMASRRCVTNQQINSITVNEDICADFIYYALKTRKQDFLTLAGGGSALPILNKSQFSKIKLLLPVLREQKAIARILSSLDDKIELNRRMNATLEQMAQALFQAWFVAFEPVKAKAAGLQPTGMDAQTAALFPKELVESELGVIPKGWEVKALDEAFEINPLRRSPSSTYLDMANVPTQGHRPANLAQREPKSGMKFTNGDTLLARITPCLENGKTAFVDFLREGEVGWGSTEFIVLKPCPPLPEYFAYLLCRDEAFRNFAIQSMSGTSGRQRVQVSSLGKYLMAVPTQEICAEFADVIQPLVKKIAGNSEQSQTLTQLRDTLLPRLISGQLRPVSEEVIG